MLGNRIMRGLCTRLRKRDIVFYLYSSTDNIYLVFLVYEMKFMSPSIDLESYITSLKITSEGVSMIAYTIVRIYVCMSFDSFNFLCIVFMI